MKGTPLDPWPYREEKTALNRVTTACAQPMRLHTTLGARACMTCFTLAQDGEPDELHYNQEYIIAYFDMKSK